MPALCPLSEIVRKVVRRKFASAPWTFLPGHLKLGVITRFRSLNEFALELASLGAYLFNYATNLLSVLVRQVAICLSKD